MLSGILILLPATMAYIFALILLTRSHKTRSQWEVTVCLLLGGTSLILDSLFITNRQYEHSYMSLLWAGTLLCIIVPSLIIQIAKVVAALQGMQKSVRWFNAFYIFPVSLFIAQILLTLDEANTTKDILVLTPYYAFCIFPMTLALVYWILYVRYKVMRYPQWQNIRYHLQGATVTPAYLITMDMFFILVLVALRFALNSLPMVHTDWWQTIYSLCLCLVLGEMGMATIYSELPVLTQSVLLSSHTTDSEQLEHIMAEETEFLPETDKQWWPEIQNYMEEKRMFLDPNLTLEQVANDLGTNQAYVSRAIHREKKVNFRSYISSLRLEYAKQYILRHPEAKLIDIALNCGFQDASTLSKRFKQEVGSTIGEWKIQGGHNA